MAGITIATLTGRNGITIAKQARQAQIEEEMKEKLILTISELQTGKLGNATLEDITQEWIDEKMPEYENTITEDLSISVKYIKVKKDGIIREFIIDKNLNVTEKEQKIKFSYEVIERKEGKASILIHIQDIESGIERIELSDQDAIIGRGRKKEIGIDYEVEMGKEYKITIISVNGEKKEETILINPEIEVTEPIIVEATYETTSVEDNSIYSGIALYIKFDATLEGTKCSINKEIPYRIYKNGTYIFTATGVYGEKTIEKEIKVIVNKYKEAKNIVQYNAGDWTEEEIRELQRLSLYDLNKNKSYGDGTFKLHSVDGLNLTFGGFTYKGDVQNKEEIEDGTIITSRNQSVSPQDDCGVPCYDGWQILKSKNTNGKTYVTSLIHAGSPENFVCYGRSINRLIPGMGNYVLVGYCPMAGCDVLPTGETINVRSWDMYEDETLKERGYIEGVRPFYAPDSPNNSSLPNAFDGLYIGSRYWTAEYVPASGYLGFDYMRGNEYKKVNEGNFGVRPVVFMNEGVYIESGSGTREDPYVLGKD